MISKEVREIMDLLILDREVQGFKYLFFIWKNCNSYVKINKATGELYCSCNDVCVDKDNVNLCAHKCKAVEIMCEDIR